MAMTAAEFAEEWGKLYAPYQEIAVLGAYENWEHYILGEAVIDDPLTAATNDYHAGYFTYYAYLRLYGWLAEGNPDLYVADKYHLHDDGGTPPANTYALTVNISPVSAGSVTLNPAPTDGRYAAGTHVTLTVLTGQGYAFSGWSGDLSGKANPNTLVMDGDKTVTASFAASSSDPTALLNQMLPLMMVVMVMGMMSQAMGE